MCDVSEIETKLDEMLGDAAAWDTPARASKKKKSERRQRGAMVSVRLSPDELATVQRAAERVGQSLSAFMRHRALDSDFQCVHGSYQKVAPLNTSFLDLDRIWRSDIHVEISPSPFVRQPSNH